MDIPGFESKVLLFNIGEDKLGRIIDLCSLHGVIPVAVTSSDHNKELGELVGFHKEIEGAYAKGTEGFADEMLVFSMVADLDDFLDDYNKMGIPGIPLKAVITPTNMKWTALQLHDELVKERDAFRK